MKRDDEVWFRGMRVIPDDEVPTGTMLVWLVDALGQRRVVTINQAGGVAVGNVQALAQDYLELQASIKELEARCGVIKDQIADLMPYEAVDAPEKLDGGVVVQWVKGRHTEKVDMTKVKKGLVLNGVPIEVIDEVYRNAATVTEGKPYLRITREVAGGE